MGFEGKYFAFADAVLRTPSMDTVCFDVFRSETLPSFGNGHQSKFTLDLDVPSWSVVVDLKPDDYDKLMGLGGRRIKENRWYGLYLSDIGSALRASVYLDPVVEEQPFGFGVTDIIYLATRSPLTQSLQTFVSLDGIPDATTDLIVSVINASEFEHHPTTGTCVACYNVGQGTCAAICQQSAYPLMYSDFGCGVLRNARTFPKYMRPCLTSHQPIVLSHWDLDHWALALRFPDAENCKWIVPRQSPMGASHVKFAHRLHQKRNLLVWPDNVERVRTRHGEIIKLPSHQDRNRSGLVMTAETAWTPTQPVRTLLPGDAPYISIPPAAQSDLSGLVVSHHGGAHRGDKPPQARVNSKCCYSYGEANSYGHPKIASVRKHQRAGWGNRRDTPYGNVCLEIKADLRMPSACAGTKSTLTLDH
jgi:hypothetical protein